MRESSHWAALICATQIPVDSGPFVGYEDDRAFLFRGSIAGNVRIGDSDATNDDVRAVLDRVGFGEWIDALPDGLAYDVGEGGELVSGVSVGGLLLPGPCSLISRSWCSTSPSPVSIP